MRLTKNMKNYIPLVPPIDKPYIDMNKKEAQAYFDWYIAHIDERADYLREKVAEGLSLPIDSLDFSLESLKPIWRWFLSVAEITKTPKRELKLFKKALKDYPQSFIDAIADESSGRLSLFTKFVLRDIGMYAGKMFTTNYPALKWTFKTTPKNYISVNEPLLVGFIDDNPTYPKPFHPDFEPIASAECCALNILDHTQHEDDFYNVCFRFTKWIPNENQE